MQSTFTDARVGDYIVPAVTFSSIDPIARVIGYFREAKEYDAIIEDGDSSSSVVSIRDLLNVENITTEKLSRIMKQVPRIGEQDKISDAAKLMFDYRLRSLPVYDGNKLLGKIECSQIAKTLVNSHSDGAIALIATPEPVCLDASDSAAKAKRLMIDRKFDQLPILKEKRLGGVITSDAIIYRLLPETDRDVSGENRPGRLDMKASALSEPYTVTNEVTDSIKKTLENMMKADSNYSVIMNNDEVQGIVTFRDYLKLIPQKSGEDIPISIVGLPDDPMQAEMAKQKFHNSVALLSRAMADLTEARAIIKSGETKAPKKRYQVQVFIRSVTEHYSYEVSEYDLGKAFEEVELWIKKLALNTGKEKYKESPRKHRDRP